MSHTRDDDPRLLKYLDELVESLRGLVGPAVKGQDPDAIHDARVATRRLKAATDLLDSIISKRSRKPFDRITRSLRKQLGPLRDMDVMLEHLNDIKAPRFESATTWLKTRLGEGRDKAMARAQKKAPPARVLARLGAWWGVRHEILNGQEAIGSLLSLSVHSQIDAFADYAAQKVGGDPHALRIAGKSLRYTLEMAKHHGFILPKGVTGLFKKMQESLGIWHDYVVLTERMLCETVECDLALHQPLLQNEILSLAQWTLRKAQVHLNRMEELWKSRGEHLHSQLRDAFPLTSPAEAPQHESVTGTIAPPSEPAAPAA